ncbi:MAG: DUF4407 domain-containing protein [Chitinophagales bacterium]|nr:DUF4407 domain-containing protein [Chitinophagales bacterium]
MKKTLLTIIFRLAGVDYNVIKNCSRDTKAKYKNLGLSLILTSSLAFIGGFDVAHQFTPMLWVCAAVGLLWAIAVFSFDYFLLNSGNISPFFKVIRVPVGFANVFITITALFVMLNQATIDSTIGLANASRITTVDSTYLATKEVRYDAYNNKQSRIEEYHQQSCMPEALNVRPGKLYDAKHALCITTHTELENELAKLDSAETGYYNAYQTNRQALAEVKSNDFFVKAKQLPAIFKANYFIVILAACAFLFLGYIELQCIILKFSIDGNDEYHTNLTRYNDGRKEHLNILMNQQVAGEMRENDLIEKDKQVKHKGKTFEVDVEDINQSIAQMYELKKLKELSKELDDETTLGKIKKTEAEYATNGNTQSKNTQPELFRMTNSMLGLVEEIRTKSDKDNLAKNLFDWVQTNVEYDTTHTKEFYRTAAETYNNRLGVCGELSVLMISLFRSAGIEASFAEVTKDDTGKEVAHACVVISSNEGGKQLVDVAYKSFDIKHTAYRVMSDNELMTNFKNWNQ